MKKYQYATTYKPRRNKKKKWIVFTFVLLILVALIVGILLWQQNTGHNVSASYTKAYSHTKKQTKLLLKGDIKKYADKLECKDNRINIGDPKQIQIVKPYAKKELKELYDNYFQDEEIELVKIDVVKKSYQPKGVSYADAYFKSKTLGEFKMRYTWQDKKYNLYIDATASKNEQFKMDCHQKINPLLNNENFVAPNLKFEQNLGKMFYYSGEEGKEKTELGKQIYRTTKLANVVYFNLSDKVYNPATGEFTRELVLCVRDKENNKIAVLKQNVIDCYDFYIPQDDARIVADDGVTWKLREQLLNLF